MLIYSTVLSSSMDILRNQKFSHGLAVISRQQTNGVGRNENQWLSPVGCLMFSIQLHIPLVSNLGQRISLIQHLVAVAIVNATINLIGIKVSGSSIKQI